MRLDAAFLKNKFERCLEMLAKKIFFFGEEGSKDEEGLDGGSGAGKPVDPDVRVLA